MTSFTLLTLGLLAGLLLSAEGRIERKLADAVSGVVDGAFDDDESTDAVYQQASLQKMLSHSLSIVRGAVCLSSQDPQKANVSIL